MVKPFGADTLIRAHGRAADRRRICLEAGRTAGLQQAIVERTLEIRLLLSQSVGTAQSLATATGGAAPARSAAAAHVDRVAALSRAVGVARGLGPDDLEVARADGHAARHGKFTLPDTLGPPRPAVRR